MPAASGRAWPQALAAAGAAVMIGDVLEDAGKRDRRVDRRRPARRPRSPSSTSPTRPAGSRAVAATVAELGGFDILVNNAGIEISALVVDLDAADLRKMLEVNVLGTALGHQARASARCARAARPARAASIVNISSVAATIAFPGIAGYSATKSAVDRLTRVAAMEAGKLGYGVRVNCVYPGLVPTEMGVKLAVDIAGLGLFGSVEAAVGAVIGLTPLGRLGEVADMADAVVFLASDAARFITGVGLPVDGGMGM